MSFQLEHAFAHLYVPYPCRTVQRGRAKICSIGVKPDWSHFASMSWHIMQHFSIETPQSYSMIKRPSSYYILISEVGKVHTEYCISMASQRAYQFSRTWLPNLASPIVTGCGEVVSVFTEPTVSQGLLMSLQFQVFLVVSFLRCVVQLDF